MVVRHEFGLARSAGRTRVNALAGYRHAHGSYAYLQNHAANQFPASIRMKATESNGTAG